MVHRRSNQDGHHRSRSKAGRSIQVVLDLVNEIGQGGHIVYSDVPEIDGFGIPEVLNNASFEAVRWNPTSREKSMGRAESADIGITFASAGIAETATIMQRCTEKSGRAVCLLPIGHIACCARAPSSLI